MGKILTNFTKNNTSRNLKKNIENESKSVKTLKKFQRNPEEYFFLIRDNVNKISAKYFHLGKIFVNVYQKFFSYFIIFYILIEIQTPVEILRKY